MVENIDVDKAARLVLEQVERVSCSFCCKYYIAPELSSCGHTLCHLCWKYERACPTCAAPLDKNTLIINKPLKQLTDHVQSLAECFEEIFDLKLDDYFTDGLEPCTLDATKNVNKWLSNSENQFSVAPTNTQQSIQVLKNVEISKRTVQIHSVSKNTNFSTKIIHVPPPQDDWDKIETLAESEYSNNKNDKNDNMEIEDFAVDDVKDNIYSCDNPRRSSRKKESKDDGSCKTNEFSRDNRAESTVEIDNKAQKAKQTWYNVKKIKKEFSRLNKQNKNRLNVSIEMCKKKNALPKSPQGIDKVVNNILDEKTKRVMSNTIFENDISKIQKEKSNIQNNNCNEKNVMTKSNVEQAFITNNGEKQCSSEEMFDKNERNESVIFNHTERDLLKSKPEKAIIPFIKKSALRRIDPVNNITVHKDDSENTIDDDIIINIKIGNTMTNITIKKKENSVQLKVKNDRAIQTSLSSNVLVNSEAKQNINKNLKHFESPKKHTASAETASARYEISDSVEKELANIMNRQEINVDRNTQTVEPSNDLDIFASTTIKESTIQLLKNTKPTHSKILVSSVKSIPGKDRNSQKKNINEENSMPDCKKQKLSSVKSKQGQDRNYQKRHINEENAMPDCKKQRLDISAAQNSLQLHKNSQTSNHDSEPMNYDLIMGQVFANIDADMEESKKSESNFNKNSVESIQNKFNAGQEMDELEIDDVEVVKGVGNVKHSENIFSNLDKGSQHSHKKPEKIVPGAETQKHIDNLLTPGICQDLVLSQVEQTLLEERNEIDIDMDMNTPRQDQDDSDKSVVEETPQKGSSYKQIANRKSGSRLNSKSKNDSQTSIINLTGSIIDKTCKSSKDLSLVHNEVSQTPTTINKFIDHVKYKSTPVAKKYIDFSNEKHTIDDDPDQTICPTVSIIEKNTQDDEFMNKVFEESSNLTSRKPLAFKNNKIVDVEKVYISGSLLSPMESTRLKLLCQLRGWQYVDTYVKQLTHLIVNVDGEKRTQRSVKYICSLAAGKWILTSGWVEQCLQSKKRVNEEPYEALDSTGHPGPRRSRLATRKLFTGITFFCMPPFSLLDINLLQDALEAAGGRVVNDVSGVCLTAEDAAPALLLAEPEDTQESGFIYMAINLSIVPVNFEWALNCLGVYSLLTIQDLLLCPSSLLHVSTKRWPKIMMDMK